MSSYDHEFGLLPESSESEDSRVWNSLSPDSISTAIDFLSITLRPRSVYLTHQFGMRTSRYKDRELLWAQGEMTNFTSAILADVWQHLQRLNPPRLLPHGHHHLRIGKGSAARMRFFARHARARHGELLVFMRRFFELNKEKPWMKGSIDRALSSALYLYYNSREGFTNRDYRITSNLRESAINRCARTILFWAWHVTDFERRARREEQRATQLPKAHSSSLVDETQGEREPNTWDEKTFAPSVQQHLALLSLLVRTYRTLDCLTRDYEQAGNQRISRGRHTGKRLRQVQKRELRKLLERLAEPDVAAEMRQYVLVLLNANTSSASTLKTSGSVRHLWRRRGRHQRALRAGQLERSQPDRRGPLMELRELRPYELECYYNELTELQIFSTQVTSLRHQIAIFLRGKPPSFPHVEPLPQSTKEARLHQYETTLEWFTDPFPSSANLPDWGRYTPSQLEHFENQARDRLLYAAASIQEPHLHPLTFVRTMTPRPENPQMSSFAVLYWTDTPTREELEQRYRRRINFRKGKGSKTNLRRRPLSKSFRAWKVKRDLALGTRYHYALAVDVHGKTAFKDYHDGRAYREQRPRREDQLTLNPQMRREFRFVNYPATRFTLPKRSSIMIFPLECTWVEHDEGLPHGDQLLQTIIRRQYRAQQELQAQHPELPLAACLPEPVLSSAHIVSSLDPQGHPLFSLHLHVEYVLPSITTPIRTIIAFSEIDHRYCYAVITSARRLIEVGHVQLPANLCRHDSNGHVSETYVYELARTMVVLAQHHHAFIALEDILYLRTEPTTSRTKNRERFANPFAKLVTALTTKALLAGLPAPHLTRGVPRQRACGQCGTKLTSGIISTYMKQAQSCHACQTAQLEAYLHVPVLLHAAALVYHLPSVEDLQCSAETLAAIFLGLITRWNDAQIAAENPGLSLPDLPIQVVRHADTPLVSTMLTSYLCTASTACAKRVRAGKRLLWDNLYGQPIETLEAVKSTVGAVGCVVWTDSLHQDVNIVAIKNAAGNVVKPTRQSITAAGETLSLDWMDDQPEIVRDVGDNSLMYPLTGITWMNIAREQTNTRKAQDAVTFMAWVVSASSANVRTTPAVALPISMRMLAETRLKDVTVAGEPLATFYRDNLAEIVDDANNHSARVVLIRLTGAGAAAPDSVFQEWIEAYKDQDPLLDVVFERVPPTTWQRARRTTSISDRAGVCASCGSLWEPSERWSACLRCGTDIPTLYNTAIVTARKTVEQLVERYAVVQTRRKGDGISSPDDVTG